MCRGFSLTKPSVKILLGLQNPEKSRVQHLQSVLFVGLTSKTKREGIRGRRQKAQWDPLWNTGVSQRLGMECPHNQEVLRLKKS